MVPLHRSLFNANKLANEIEGKLLESGGEITPEVEDLIGCEAFTLKDVKSEVDLLAMTSERIEQLILYYNNQIKHLEKLVKGLEASEERLHENILGVLVANDASRLEGQYKELKVRNNPPRVEILDELAVSDEFKIMKMAETINKKAISEALKAGQELHFARLVSSKSLVIGQAKPKSYEE